MGDEWFGTKWEYKSRLSAVGGLNELGAEGWELVAISGGGLCFFKRPIIEENIRHYEMTAEERDSILDRAMRDR